MVCISDVVKNANIAAMYKRGTDTQSNTKVRMVEIDSQADGQRIDNYLLKTLKGVPKSHLYRILRKGEVRVNKGRIKANYRLKSGDMVRIPPIKVSADNAPKNIPATVLEQLKKAILYEDDQILVLNKPSGMAVHGGSGLNFGIIEAMRRLGQDYCNLELVHRLDRETSGCLLFAKTRKSLLAMHESLKDQQMNKDYLLLVDGLWNQDVKRVSVALQKNALSGGERMVQVSEQGKEAVTEFDIVRRYRNATLLRARLLTGRTHQIRVHAAHLGHPILGDVKYGDDEANRRIKMFGLKRLFLHAQAISFAKPGSDRWLNFDAPLPNELSKVLQRLEDE